MKIGLEVEIGVFKRMMPVVCDFLPYTKEDPLTENGNVYHKDASMLEMAMRPCSTGKELDSTYKEALKKARSLLPRQLSLKCVPSACYSDDE